MPPLSKVTCQVAAGKAQKDQKEQKEQKNENLDHKGWKDGKNEAKDRKDTKDGPDALKGVPHGKELEAPPPPGSRIKYQEFSAISARQSQPSPELTDRIGAIERRLTTLESEVAEGQTFIRREERPTIGEQTVADPDEEEG